MVVYWGHRQIVLFQKKTIACLFLTILYNKWFSNATLSNRLHAYQPKSFAPSKIAVIMVINTWSFSKQGSVLISDKPSYREISQSNEGTRSGVKMFVSLWNLTGTSAAVLSRYLSNFKAAIAQIYIYIYIYIHHYDVCTNGFGIYCIQ